ncbi:MAG TPA: hypothetical protein H9903_10495 [Candidatus Aquabacterium excrementipullorum]|nr:hypothetical protein [Candidatus Aquabacterium excrementipullorum]
MKHTIKIGDNKAVVIEPKGSQVSLSVQNFGFTMIERSIDPQAAAALAGALNIAAEQAVTAKAG